jgi:hypothetical protein
MTTQTNRERSRERRRTRVLTTRRPGPSPTVGKTRQAELDAPSRIEAVVPWILLAMGVVLFVVAIVSILSGAYLAGTLTSIAIVTVALAGILRTFEEIEIYGIKLRRSRPPGDE